MKTRLVLLTLLTAIGFTAQACDTWDLDCNGRISADEARASDRANTAQNEANSIPPATTGLKPWIGDDDSGANQMGKWVKVGGSANSASAGEYSVILAPSAVGKSCLKGQKGLIMDKGEVCTSFSSSDRCLSYSDNGMLVTSGAKAECR